MTDQISILACALSLLPPPLQRHAAEQLRSGYTLPDLMSDRILNRSLERKIPNAEQSLAIALKNGQKIVAVTTPNYPSALHHLPIPPAIIFIRGSLNFLSQEKEHIAIVGARSASVTDCLFVSQVAKELASDGVCVISGLALGVDGAAHRGALSAQIHSATIAVLAHGLDTTYPRSHLELAERILNNEGSLISEYPPGTPPLRHHFLARNRIIAALAKTTIVAQAGARSGSLVTAQVSLELGREVCVLSNPSTTEVSEGSTKLIQDGALSVQSAKEILALTEAPSKVKRLERGTVPPSSTTTTHDTVVLPLTDLLRISKYSLAYLLDLELEGKITRLPGNQISVPSTLFSELSSNTANKTATDPQ